MTDTSIRPLTNFEKVKLFHKTFGHPVATELTMGDAKLRRLRIRLIAEELAELVDALGFTMKLTTLGKDKPLIQLDQYTDIPDPVGVGDALADIEYVTQGGYLAFGLPGAALFEEAQTANMSKAGPDGKAIYDEHGKIQKGPNYREPNMLRVLLTYDSNSNMRDVPLLSLGLPVPEAEDDEA